MIRTAGDLSKRHSPAASPVARRASALAWNPTAEPPGTRARSRRLYRGTTDTALLSACTAIPLWRPLNLRATRSGRQSRHRPATALASELHHRTDLRTATSLLLPGSSSLPGPAVSLGYERNHNHTTAQCLLRPTQIFARSTRRQSATNSHAGRRAVAIARARRRPGGSLPLVAGRPCRAGFPVRVGRRAAGVGLRCDLWYFRFRGVGLCAR